MAAYWNIDSSSICMKNRRIYVEGNAQYNLSLKEAVDICKKIRGIVPLGSGTYTAHHEMDWIRLTEEEIHGRLMYSEHRLQRSRLILLQGKFMFLESGQRMMWEESLIHGEWKDRLKVDR